MRWRASCVTIRPQVWACGAVYLVGCNMANKIYVGDIGVVFRVSTGIDLTAATVTKLKISCPSGTEVERTATVYGTAANGVLTYTSTASDLTEAGIYRLQAYVELGADGVDGKFYGETATFMVYDRYY